MLSVNLHAKLQIMTALAYPKETVFRAATFGKYVGRQDEITIFAMYNNKNIKRHKK